jgi:hypothetical protein
MKRENQPEMTGRHIKNMVSNHIIYMMKVTE